MNRSLKAQIAWHSHVQVEGITIEDDLEKSAAAHAKDAKAAAAEKVAEEKRQKALAKKQKQGEALSGVMLHHSE